VVDTGIDRDRLKGATLLPGVNLTLEGNPSDSTDHHGHGTAVATTILRFAPRTRLVPVKVMDRRGVLGAPEDLEAAFAWLLEHQASIELGLICAPFADTTHATSDEAYRGSRLCRQIESLRALGVATVAAAGNGYTDGRAYNPQGMAWPAILREIVSVGAVRCDAEGFKLARTSQRLHADLGTGCHTTIFAVPEAPGDTSGAAAGVAGFLAAIRPACGNGDVDGLVRTMLASAGLARDEHGLLWPTLCLDTDTETV
jgi:subtilisin family serine protease